MEGADFTFVGEEGSMEETVVAYLGGVPMIYKDGALWCNGKCLYDDIKNDRDLQVAFMEDIETRRCKMFSSTET